MCGDNRWITNKRMYEFDLPSPPKKLSDLKDHQ